MLDKCRVQRRLGSRSIELATAVEHLIPLQKSTEGIWKPVLRYCASATLPLGEFIVSAFIAFLELALPRYMHEERVMPSSSNPPDERNGMQLWRETFMQHSRLLRSEITGLTSTTFCRTAVGERFMLPYKETTLGITASPCTSAYSRLQIGYLNKYDRYPKKQRSMTSSGGATRNVTLESVVVHFGQHS
jgi:hypothetical protein